MSASLRRRPLPAFFASYAARRGRLADSNMTTDPSTPPSATATSTVAAAAITGPIALHASWTDGSLHLWAERGPSTAAATPPAGQHPAAVASTPLLALLSTAVGPAITGHEALVRLMLPARKGVPVPSPAIAQLSSDQPDLALSSEPASDAAPDTAPDVASDLPAPASLIPTEDDEPMVLVSVAVPTVRFSGGEALAVLDCLDSAFDASADDLTMAEAGTTDSPLPHLARVAVAAPSLRFWMMSGRMVRWLLTQQRFVPSVTQDFKGQLKGLWQPWIADEATTKKLQQLVNAMPPAARAVDDHFRHQGWPILDDFLLRTTDAACRAVLHSETMIDTLEGKTPETDAHVAWLSGLLSPANLLRAKHEQRPDLLKRVRNWIGGLDDRGTSSVWRLFVRLDEPVDIGSLADFETPTASMVWPMVFGLQSVEDPTIFIDAQDLWLLSAGGATVAGKKIESPHELFLTELGRLARVYKPVEKALVEPEPTHQKLSTAAAYEFLRDWRSVLLEQGFCVQVPKWWDSPSTRLGVRLEIDSGPMDGPGAAPAGVGAKVGLGTLVNYKWQISIGQTSLSIEEFEKLATVKSPLVMIGGRWVEVRPEDIQNAIEFIRENPGGQMELGRAIRLAYAADLRQTGLPVVGLDVQGWLASVFGGDQQKMTMLEPPEGFVGSLRPYQLKGLSWLSFLDRCGLGACLADDMGLGKTIQLLAMLLWERKNVFDASGGTQHVGPTLLVVPMSVIGNWVREAKRFAPSLDVMVHHGPERKLGQEFADAASAHDVVVTTYALANRDNESFEMVQWWRIALDEAQNIKNPGAKQSLAIRSLQAARRIALTGTPIENRLSELWSIMDFLNPGLLGSVHDFKERFAMPIEKFHDAARAKKLRGLVQPFVLRRLKTDPTVIADLPEKVETKEYCYLTPEQAQLYQSTVTTMLQAAENADGIQRRGVILAGLVKLKQICNHPLQFLKEHDPEAKGSSSPSRSGKCVRLIQMMEEVLASGGQALIFTQFKQMGEILQHQLARELKRDVLFLHGGTTLKERENMVASFQKQDGKCPIFLLSLKAGGVGLNLTAANHVFHFDRWWNPAVESQATDRAFRIGQTRTVQVHKFIVSGTLEERIDQMIEMKTELADNVIGSGENWLTELSLNQLKDVLMLRPDAVAESGESSDELTEAVR